MNRTLINKMYDGSGDHLEYVQLYNVTGMSSYHKVEASYDEDGHLYDVRFSTRKALPSTIEIILLWQEEVDKDEIQKITGGIAAYFEEIRISLLKAEAV